MKALVRRRLGLHAADLDVVAPRRTASHKFEYSVLVLLATLGMMVMVSANDLMSLYVGLELQ